MVAVSKCAGAFAGGRVAFCCAAQPLIISPASPQTAHPGPRRRASRPNSLRPISNKHTNLSAGWCRVNESWHRNARCFLKCDTSKEGKRSYNREGFCSLRDLWECGSLLPFSSVPGSVIQRVDALRRNSLRVLRPLSVSSVVGLCGDPQALIAQLAVICLGGYLCGLTTPVRETFLEAQREAANKIIIAEQPGPTYSNRLSRCCRRRPCCPCPTWTCCRAFSCASCPLSPSARRETPS